MNKHLFQKRVEGGGGGDEKHQLKDIFLIQFNGAAAD